MARIAVGGWQHETNTFATIKADYAAFERQDDWPALSEGESMLRETEGVHLPITGATGALTDLGHELVPLLWCSATPSAQVTKAAFEAISARFLALLQSALPVDGVFLDLHGAMVCEHLEDGEGEFLRRVRSLVGPEIPVVASLDLHANVTQLMVDQATALDIFRTYPHIDMGETGERAARLLARLVESPVPLYPAFRQIGFMIPLNAGCTLIEPCQTIYRRLPQLMDPSVAALSFACGFHLSDIQEVGPSVIAYGESSDGASIAADALVSEINARQADFFQKIYPVEEGVKVAMGLAQDGVRPVVVADTQDNPGGGGSGDTTGLLQVLVSMEARNAVFGAIADSVVADLAHSIGVGGEFDALLGGKSGLEGQAPWPCRCRVLALGDGNVVGTGPMYLGAKMALGPTALIDIQGVHVVVISSVTHLADRSILRHVGVEMEDYDIVAIKSSVHFRNDFTKLAGEILLVAAPGAVFCDPRELTYRHNRANLLARDM